VRTSVGLVEVTSIEEVDDIDDVGAALLEGLSALPIRRTPVRLGR
jgi:hypothetical protein